MDTKIEIPFSKKKIVLLLVAAIAFVVVGVLFVLNPGTFERGVLRNAQMVQLLGVISILFFGVGGYFLSKKLLESKSGLIIDEHGITDNSNATSVGLIEWRDITGVETIILSSNKILMILTINPEKYISRASNAIIRRTMKANHEMFGSPIQISVNSLKISHSELYALIIAELDKRKERGHLTIVT